MRSHVLAALGLGLCLAATTTSARDAEVTLTVEGRSSQTPWAAALGDFVAVAFGAQTAQGAADVLVAISRDGGLRFETPVRVNTVAGDARLGGELPPRVALVPRAGLDPTIVVAYGAKTSGTEIRTARSTDGGRTFSTARVLQAPGAAGDRGWHALTIDAAGVAHIMWLDHRGLAAAKGEHAHHTEQAAIDGVAMAQRSGLYYARDDGSAVERELVAGVCYCCKVALATTPSGGLVATWRHVYAGNIRDIAFITSPDNGGHFDTPGRVSTDSWQLAGCPDDGPALAVDATGTSHVVWPTVLSTPAPEGALFYASSPDGRSFGGRVRIPTLGSPKPMHPQITVAGPDRLVVAWDEVVNGTRQAAVRTLRFDEAGQPIFSGVQRLGSAETPSSYPILVKASSRMLAVYVHGKAGESVIRVAGL